MSFGIYIHIPYCIQRCTYCDFATYEQSSILPPKDYVDRLLKELKFYSPLFNQRTLNTIYFGGGTPSLIAPKLLHDILNEIRNQGFKLSTQAEITIEINPATVSEQNLQEYLKMGINRFSVGAQTFKDEHLKKIGREHNALDTFETLQLLSKYKLNFTFDILFALPNQTKAELLRDLEKVLEFNPSHVSPYCLTVPSNNPLSKNRASDEVQIEMFELIKNFLLKNGYNQYEISNFAKTGYESQHNMLYWQDDSYWGVGLSSHSYERDYGLWGVRYWNPRSINEYVNWIDSLEMDKSNSSNLLLEITKQRKSDHFEILERHQSLTDFCHISLRVSKGLSFNRLEQKFGKNIADHIAKLMEPLIFKKWIKQTRSDLSQDLNWSLTDEGIVVSNQVFAELTFLKEDLLF